MIRVALGRALCCGIVVAAAIAGLGQAGGQEPPDISGAPSSAELSAAFPDLGGMEARYMMIEDPFETFVLLDQLEIRDADQTALSLIHI